jgi:metallo-beta-lactamase class B
MGFALLVRQDCFTSRIQPVPAAGPAVKLADRNIPEIVRGSVVIRLFCSLLIAVCFSSGLPAQTEADWSEPFPPHRVIANIYYVGTRGLASYLITTSQGAILINSGLESSVPLIRDSVQHLGFRFSDIKILLISHAHADHCAGSAVVKRLTGARYMVMEGDAAEVERGGKGNFQYDTPASLYEPAKVDRVLHDGDAVRLGGTELIAHLTPGHTKGCTTWTMKAREGSTEYNVVIVGSPNVNPGYRLMNNALYPRIAEDYEHTFDVLRALPCDVFLGAHGSYYGMEAKFARMKQGGPNPFVDPEGYKRYVDDRQQAFRSELKRQQASAK